MLKRFSEENQMEHGDFTGLARHYINRPAYCPELLDRLLAYTGCTAGSPVAEAGAGTGKFTLMLGERELRVFAVEPNEAMIQEGIRYTVHLPCISWSRGTGAETGLADGSVRWAVMASSFHWTDPTESLPEFRRILSRDGFFTALWNPRNIEVSEFHSAVEKEIAKIVPELKRVSSGSRSNSKDWGQILVSTDDFSDAFYMEADYSETMSRQRYLGVWDSVNDIRVQAGEARWSRIKSMLAEITAGTEEILVPYKIRSWTVRRKD
jgi:ubiquinone/menaquinone biosynthesis C-methylase UbiE